MRAPRYGRLLTAALSAVWLGACAGAERVATQPAPEQRTLTVLTYNVNYGLQGDESGVGAIRDAKADVVLLQETTHRWEAAIEAQLVDEYPTRRYLRAPVAGGMAVVRAEAPSPSWSSAATRAPAASSAARARPGAGPRASGRFVPSSTTSCTDPDSNRCRSTWSPPVVRTTCPSSVASS